MAGGGPITAAVDVLGGPILAGDHRGRDTQTTRRKSAVSHRPL